MASPSSGPRLLHPPLPSVPPPPGWEAEELGLEWPAGVLLHLLPGCSTPGTMPGSQPSLRALPPSPPGSYQCPECFLSRLAELQSEWLPQYTSGLFSSVLPGALSGIISFNFQSGLLYCINCNTCDSAVCEPGCGGWLLRSCCVCYFCIVLSLSFGKSVQILFLVVLNYILW